MSQASLRTVELLALPLDLHRRAAVHQEALQREFDILRLSESDAEVPERLQTLIDDLEQRYSGLTGRPEAELAAALASDAAQIDLAYQLPEDAGAAAAELGRMLDDVDEFCRSGQHLVTLATPPPLRSYRQWFLNEFSVQLAGGPATPWPIWSEQRSGVTHSPTERGSPRGEGTAPSRCTVRLQGAIDLATAGAVREELRAAAETATEIRVDLRAVDFLDSVGLSVLVNAHSRAAQQRELLEVVVPPHLRQLFELTGLDRVLTLVDS